MSNTDPLRLPGAKYRRDKTGLVQIVEPWEVHTIDDCEIWVPAQRPFGLPIIDRQAEEFEVGTWQLSLTYEGYTGVVKPDFATGDGMEIELDTTMSGDPIKSHPNFDQLKIKYGWDTARDEFPETLPGDATAGTSTTSQPAKPNPLHGVDSYLAIGAIFRMTFAARTFPQDLLDGIGAVFAKPTGWELLGLPLPAKRNWLKLAPRARLVGNAPRVGIEFMLSGPNGWIRDIYGRQQLNRGGSGQSGGGLIVTGLTTGSL